MKQTLTLFFGILLISACSEVRFSQPQPINGKELTEFPTQFVGKYVGADGDTLMVNSECFLFSGDEIKKLCSNRVVLKKKGSLHIISSRDMFLSGEETQRKGWEVLPFELVNDSLIIYFLNTTNDEKNNETISKLDAILEVEKIINDEGNIEYYYIDPTIRQFKKILRSECFSIAEKFARID